MEIGVGIILRSPQKRISSKLRGPGVAASSATGAATQLRHLQEERHIEV